MNQLDRFLAKVPAPKGTWWCPWFGLIMLFAANGVVFGAYAAGVDNVYILGTLAVVVGLLSGIPTFLAKCGVWGGDSC